MAGKLGIVAGQGTLPHMIAANCRSEGRDVFMIAITSETDPDLIGDTDHVWRPLGGIGGTIKALKRAACEDLIFVGRMERPDFGSLKLDMRGTLLLPRLIKAATKGDDAIISVLVTTFESEGFNVVAVEDVLKSLVAEAGTPTIRQPDEADFDDIARGREVIEVLGELDIGQGAVIRRGHVIAVEAAEGTDRMIARSADFMDGGQAGILIKMPKPGQERRVDLPTIGVETVRNAAAAGLAGIVVEAGGALMVERERMIELANDTGLFLHVFSSD